LDEGGLLFAGAILSGAGACGRDNAERAAHRIVVELAAADYIARKRNGRRNHYTIRSHLPLPGPLAREQKIGDLLAILARQPAETKWLAPDAGLDT
jgi:hypothetical protein